MLLSENLTSYVFNDEQTEGGLSDKYNALKECCASWIDEHIVQGPKWAATANSHWNRGCMKTAARNRLGYTNAGWHRIS